MRIEDLSVAMSGLDRASIGIEAGVRAGLDWIKSIRSGEVGVAGAQLDARDAEIRPRDLGRSARRDLAASFRRIGLRCSGLDLWIPPEHFAENATADRATGAVLAAIELAAELESLGRWGGNALGGSAIAVCTTFPPKGAEAVVASLGARALERGVVLADFGWPVDGGEGVPGVRIGLDPARIVAAGGDAVVAATALGLRLGAVRLTDVSSMGMRVPVGSRDGRLDVLAWKVSLTTTGFLDGGRMPVIDLRGMASQAGAAEAAVEAWIDAR
ncbi:MAG: hypothetical protein KF745_02540 [Phycisphaeraceae bacterium]|nr:hypothetical protein [Phycisphaeraceae bacterium]